MGTIVLDFDSTLITCESLEEIFKEKAINVDLLDKIKTITKQGMEGEITFLESVSKRLSLSPINKRDFEAFGKRAVEMLTPGMKELLNDLKSHGFQLWIVSGAARDAMLPLGRILNIPEERILGVELIWSAKGDYKGIDDKVAINRSKWEGAQAVASHWRKPIIAVGDGITDFALLTHGLVDHFIAFTSNVRRQPVLDKGVPEAKNVAELRKLIEEIAYD